MLKKRLIAFVLSAAIGVALAFGISAAFPPVFTDGSIQEGLCYETTGVCPDAIVATVDGTPVPADLYFYFLCYEGSEINSMLQYYMGGNVDWDMELGEGRTIRDIAKDGALALTQQQLGIENMAKQYGVTLSDTELSELAAIREQTVEAVGGEEAYLAEIDKMGLREETYDRLLGSSYLYNSLGILYDTSDSPLYADADTLMAYAQEQGYIAADHILIKTVDDQMQPLDEETAAAQKALAEDILSQLQVGDGSYEAFAALADKYSEDPGRLANPTGYTFTTGEMVEEFDTAARALAEGETSGLVESSYGYHIIYRLPLTDSAVETVRNAYFDELVSEYIAASKAVTSPVAGSMDPQAAYEAMLAAQTNG